VPVTVAGCHQSRVYSNASDGTPIQMKMPLMISISRREEGLRQYHSTQIGTNKSAPTRYAYV